jgi:hypothetical protein
MVNKLKIIPRLFGGLGNQLFIYATARRLAIVNNAELILDNVSGFVRDYTYRRSYQLDHFNISSRVATPAERLEPFPILRRNLMRGVNRRRPFEARRYIQQEGIDFDPRLLLFKAHGTVYLEGYWQSEKYFKDVEYQIREDLNIIPPIDLINREMVKRIRTCLAVAVHLRFFDTPNDSVLNNVHAGYYARAFAIMEKIAPEAHYFVFSDQPETAIYLLPMLRHRITLVSHNQADENAFSDLWLMSQCRHFITSNSTFSWWGAWLAKSTDKQVITPGMVMREGKSSWGFDGLIPDTWLTI